MTGLGRRFETGRRVGGRYTRSVLQPKPPRPPDEVFGPLLESWHNFDSPNITITNDKISNVTDLTGNGHDLSQNSPAKRPVQVSGSHGRMVAELNGTSTFLEATTYSLGEGARSSQIIIWKEKNFGVVAGYITLFGTGTGNNPGWAIRTAVTASGGDYVCFGTVDTNPDTIVFDFPGTPTLGHDLVECHFFETGRLSVLNGVPVTSIQTVGLGSGAAGPMTTLKIGASKTGSENGEGNVSLSIVLNDIPTLDQINEFRAWCAKVYDVNIV